MLTYYPPTVNFRSIEKLAPGLGRLQDVRETQRLKDVERKKMLGKGPPKKGKFHHDWRRMRRESDERIADDFAFDDGDHDDMDRRGSTCGYEGQEEVKALYERGYRTASLHSANRLLELLPWTRLGWMNDSVLLGALQWQSLRIPTAERRWTVS